MIVGVFTFMIISMMEIGGFEEVKRRYMLVLFNVIFILLIYNFFNINFCNVYFKIDVLKMLRNLIDEDVFWFGFVFG